MVLNPDVHLYDNIRNAKGSHLLIMPLYFCADNSQACRAAWDKLPTGTAPNKGYNCMYWYEQNDSIQIT